MATRNIKDAKDLITGELIYFKGHAQATFMSDGRTVEEAVSGISGGESIDTSNLATKNELAQKQDKLVSGTNIKTINGESILGSGDITIEGGSGSLTENDDVTVKSITVKDSITVGDSYAVTIDSYGRVDASDIRSANGFTDYSNGCDYYMTLGDYGIEIVEPNHTDGGSEKTILTTITSGDGTKFLSDDGTYKTISSGGDSNADSGGDSNAYKVITIEHYHWTVGTTYGPLLPNTKYICLNPLVALIFFEDPTTLEDAWHGGVTDIYNEYTIIFEGNDCDLTLPDYILWANGVQPIIENGVRYELSISLMYINNEYIAHAILTPFKPIE